jgi:tRNA U54 and U55 pseudouridine synthase Pus10
MMYHKSLDAAGYIVLEQRLKAYMASIAADSRETSDSTAEKSPANRRVSWKVSSRACPVYLLGRYRKLARDVPQSPWTVAAHGSGEDADAGDALEVDAPEDANKRPRTEGGSAEGRGDDQGGAAEEKAAGKSVTIQYQRKGRCSVEEVVNAEVRKALGAADCRMHACGREDIDVRCLGECNEYHRSS